MSEMSRIFAPPGLDEHRVELKVRRGVWVHKGQLVAIFKKEAKPQSVIKLKADCIGKVVDVLKSNRDIVHSGELMFTLSPECSHPTLFKNMCAECGSDLQKDDSKSKSKESAMDVMKSAIAVLHSIPELKVSSDEAFHLGKADEVRLLKNRQLVLLVDLDQTLIHTTNENIPPNLKDVYHFQLYGPRSPWYHTRIRPHTKDFLLRISQFYELHICTFGARLYAHTVAGFLDCDSKYFSHRILSRDECFDSRSKTANMSSLFPCGDHMVCIIDDREDVWNFAPNLVHVKPYNFFKNTGDINAPPGSSDAPIGCKQSDSKSVRRKRGKKRVAVDLQEEQASTSEKNDMTLVPSADVKKIEEGQQEEPEPSQSTSESKLIVSDSPDVSPKESLADKNAKAPDSEQNTELGSELQSSQKDTETGNESHSSQSSSTSTNSADDLPKSEVEAESGEKRDKDQDAAVDDLIEVEDEDDYLLYLEDILKTIHKAFYDLFDQMKEGKEEKVPDLKTVIPYVKRKVLQGMHLVFSGVIPTKTPLEKSRVYLVARSLGATVTDAIVDQTTHLVAAKLGTAKVQEAKSRGHIKLVTPDWLWCCAERWEKVDERLYPVSKWASVTLKPPAHCSSPEIAFAERCPVVPKMDEMVAMPETLNPFLAFSSEDLKGMDKEVEDILSDQSSSDEEEAETSRIESNQKTSSGSTQSRRPVKGLKRKRGEMEHEEDEDDDDEDDEDDEEEDDANDDLAKSNDDEDDSSHMEKFLRGAAYSSDYEIEAQSDDDEENEDDEGDWSRMGAQLERKFLDENSN